MAVQKNVVDIKKKNHWFICMKMYKIKSLPLLRQYVVIITVNLLALCMGMDIGWTSPTLVKLRDPKESPLSRPVTEDESGWIVSIGYMFSIFALPFMGFLVDYFGRRYSILVACLPKVIAGTTTIFATELWMLLVARVISSLTTTAALLFIMIYTTEIASKEIRGFLGTFLALFSNSGILMMLAIGPYISYVHLCVMVTAVALCASIPLLFIPDTPYSLYNKGKVDEAKKVLVFFRGSETLAEEELKELSQVKTHHKLNKTDFLKNKVYLKTLGIALAMSFGVQLVGFNFISFYLQTILELSNTTVSPALGSVIIGVIQITSTIFASLIIDRFGRKPILITTLLAMAGGMIGLGTFFIIKQHGIISGLLNYLPLICIAVVTSCFSGGIGALYFVVISEILDGPIRAIGTTIGAVTSNLCVFLLSRYALNILSAMGPDVTFIMFGVVSIVMCVFVVVCLPETKQKTIAEIQMSLGAGKEDRDKNDIVTRF